MRDQKVYLKPGAFALNTPPEIVFVAGFLKKKLKTFTHKLWSIFDFPSSPKNRLKWRFDHFLKNFDQKFDAGHPKMNLAKLYQRGALESY